MMVFNSTMLEIPWEVDFSLPEDSVSECIEKVARGLVAYGVTSFCPTIVTSPPDYYKKVQYKFSLLLCIF